MAPATPAELEAAHGHHAPAVETAEESKSLSHWADSEQLSQGKARSMDRAFLSLLAGPAKVAVSGAWLRAGLAPGRCRGTHSL